MGGWREAPAAPRASAPGGSARVSARSTAWRDALQPLRDAAARRPPASPDAQAELAAAALSRLASAGGAAACSAELGGETLGADVALLCRALSLSASSAPLAPDARRAAALDALAAALDEVLERRAAALPSAAAAPVAAALSSALRSAEGEALQRASQPAEPPLAALRAMSALLQDHGQHVPSADVAALAAALLPWAFPAAPDVRSRAPTPEPRNGTEDELERRMPRHSVSSTAAARREPSRLALSALGALCSRLGAGVLPPAQAAAVLAAAAAALTSAAGPPGATPAAPLPARPPAEDAATARYCGAALRCAHLCAPPGPSVTARAAGATWMPSSPPLPPPLVATLLGQARRFMVYGLPRPGAPRPWGEAGSDESGGDESGAESDTASVTSSASASRGGADERAARVRAAACHVAAALARASPRAAHPHWPALLAPRGGGPAAARAALPGAMARDPSPRVRAAAAAALAALLDGPPARAFLAIADCRAGARSAAAAASLSAQLADGAVAAHGALISALDSEEVLPTLVAACRAAAAFALAAPFARLPPQLAPSLAAAAWRRAGALQQSTQLEAAATRLALLSTLVAVLTTRAPAPALATAMGCDDVAVAQLRLGCDDVAVLRTVLRDLAAVAGLASAAMPLRLEAWAALRGAGRGYPAAFAAAWGDAAEGVRHPSGIAAALEGCAAAADDKLAAAAVRCLADAMRAAGGSGSDGDGSDEADCAGGPTCSVPAAAPATDAHVLASMWVRVSAKALPAAMAHAAPAVRAVAAGAVAGLTAAAAEQMPKEALASLRAAPLAALQRDTAPAVRAAAARALGALVGVSSTSDADTTHAAWLLAATAALRAGCADASAAVVVAASCGAANAAAACRSAVEAGVPPPLPCAERAALAAAACAVATRGSEKARPHAARCLGHLAAAEAPGRAAMQPTWLAQGAAALRFCLAPAAGPKAQLGAAVACEPMLRCADAAVPMPPAWVPELLAALATSCVAPQTLPAKLRLHAAAALGAPGSRAAFGGAWAGCLSALADALGGLDDAERPCAASDVAADDPPADARLRPTLRAALTAAMLHVITLGDAAADGPAFAALLSEPRGAALLAALRAASAAVAASASSQRRQSTSTALPDDPFGLAPTPSGGGGDESPAAAHRRPAAAEAAEALALFVAASPDEATPLPFDAAQVAAAATAAAAMCAAVAEEVRDSGLEAALRALSLRSEPL